MEPLAARLGLDHPLVVENGGAVVLPPSSAGPAHGDPRILPLGTPRARLVAALPALARAAGLELRPFSAMTPAQVAELTGLAPEDAQRAQQRQFDEPFLVSGEAGSGGAAPPAGTRDAALDARLERAAQGLGLRVVHGGRLHHLTGPADKGSAVQALLRLAPYRDGASLALGDAANDLPMLRAVERAIVMPGAGGVDPALAAALPAAERAPLPGPAGWNQAVLTVLAGGTLPRVAA
jgi:mannosyl-3-phosphoglycerate phosphatase